MDLAFPSCIKKKQLPGKRKRTGDPVACCNVNDLFGLQILEVLAFHKSSCTTQTLFLTSTSVKDGRVVQEGLVNKDQSLKPS